MSERTQRLSSLANLTQCSFGGGRCVWRDEAEASRRCPKARPRGQSRSEEAVDGAERVLPAAPSERDDCC